MQYTDEGNQRLTYYDVNRDVRIYNRQAVDTTDLEMGQQPENSLDVSSGI